MPDVRKVEQLLLEPMPLCFTSYGRLGYWICWTRDISSRLVRVPSMYAHRSMLTQYSSRSLPDAKRVVEQTLELKPLYFITEGRLRKRMCWIRHIAAILV
jgi:hypothetical protein